MFSLATRVWEIGIHLLYSQRKQREKEKITSGQIVMADCRIWYCKVIFHSRVESYREGRNQDILSLLQSVLIKSNSLDYPN